MILNAMNTQLDELNHNTMKPVHLMKNLDLDSPLEYSAEYASFEIEMQNAVRLMCEKFGFTIRGELHPKEAKLLYETFVVNRMENIINSVTDYVQTNISVLSNDYNERGFSDNVNALSRMLKVSHELSVVLYHMKEIVKEAMLHKPVELDGHFTEAFLQTISRDIDLDIGENISVFSMLAMDLHEDFRLVSYVSDAVTRKLLSNKDMGEIQIIW